jgi:RNA polymerase sigma factor (sigma-70 family)
MHNMNISKSLKNDIGEDVEDGELFERMAGGGEVGLAAFGIFYSRYAEELNKRTCRVEGLSDADSEDLMQEAMLRAYRAASTFKPPDASLNSDAKWSKTMFWLIEIARNIHLEKIRKLEADGVNGFESLEVEDESGEFSHFITDILKDGEGFHLVREAEEKAIQELVPSEETESEKMQILKGRLNRLPKKKQDILLVYFGDEYDYRTPKRPLSRELIGELKEKYSETSENLRQIKGRAFKVVKADCQKEEQIRKEKGKSL